MNQAIIYLLRPDPDDDLEEVPDDLPLDPDEPTLDPDDL